MAGVLYTIDLNDKASAKARALGSNLTSTDRAANRLSGDLKRITLSGLQGKLSTLRSLRDNTDTASRAFRNLSKEIVHTERRLDTLGNTGRNTSGLMGLGFASLAYGGLRILTSGLKTAVAAQIELEKETTRFGVLLNSTFRANRLVDWATQYANVTPLLRQDILRVTSTLLQYGIVEKDVRSAVQSLGDISGGDAERLKSLGLAYGQVKAAGRLRGQELLQMINAGYNPLQKLGEMSGKSVAVLRTEMSKGLITFEQIAEVFKKDTSAGGRFYQMLNKMSQTVGGRLSTLADAYNTKMGLMGKRFEGVTKWGVGALTTLVNTKGALEATTVAVGALSIAMAIAAVRATAMGTAMLSSAAALATNPYVLAIAALTALGIAIWNVREKYEALAYSAERSRESVEKKGQALVGAGMEEDARKKVAFEADRERLKVLNALKKQGTTKEKESAEKEIKSIQDRQEELAGYLWKKYGHDTVKGVEVLNNKLGASMKDALQMMLNDTYKFFETVRKEQSFVTTGVGTKERLEELRKELYSQPLTPEQLQYLARGEDDEFGLKAERVFPVKGRSGLGWAGEGEVREYKFPGEIPADVAKEQLKMRGGNIVKSEDLKRLGNVREFVNLRKHLESLGTTSFREGYFEKETATTPEVDASVDALQKGITSGGARTTNIYIQPKKGMVNIEQWIGDTQENVRKIGGDLAEGLDRILSSIVGSAAL